MTGKSRVGIYLRISDDREGRELGVQRQEEDCRALLQRMYEATLVDVYRDNDRGASRHSRKRRPEYERLLADARAGRINHIVAYTSSRLTRRPREHEDQIDLAIQHGVQYGYVRSPSFDLNTAAGREVARILAARDAGEADEISERVSRDMLRIAEEGGYRGGQRPFGFERDGMTVREYEAEVLRDASERALAGETLKSISRELNERGVPRATWHPPLVLPRWRTGDLSALLRRPRNAGLIDRQGEIIGAAKWPAVVPEPTWRALLVKLSDFSRLNNNGNAPRWLGSGLYICGGCGRPTLHVSMSGNRKPSYRCNLEHPATNGKHVTRAALPLDAYVEASVVSFLTQPEHRGTFAPPVAEVDVRALHVEEVALSAKLRELEDMLGDGELSRAAFNRQVVRVEQRRSAVQAELVVAGGVDPVAQLVSTPDISAAWFGNGPERSGGLSLERRRTIIKRVARVIVHPQGPGPFRPEHVEIIMPPAEV
jgi:site-specific DNA recombinase